MAIDWQGCSFDLTKGSGKTLDAGSVARPNHACDTAVDPASGRRLPFRLPRSAFRT
jgi:hypothetical protein